jgi:hypothetical protein
LLAWLWAIFGAVFGRISITQPTNKYENFVFERATYKYCWEVKELGVPDLLCIRTLLDRAIAGGAGSEVYEQLANVFKGVGIDDEMLPLCKYDFARLDLRSGDVKNWHVMAALVAVISFCGIKIRYCAGETLGRIDCIEMPAFSGGASEDSAAKFKQSRFCIDTTGNVYPNKVFPGYYTKICKYTFNEPGEKIYVYAGKGEYGHGIIFYTTKKAKQLDSHFNKSATGYYRVIGDFF